MDRTAGFTTTLAAGTRPTTYRYEAVFDNDTNNFFPSRSFRSKDALASYMLEASEHYLQKTSKPERPTADEAPSSAAAKRPIQERPEHEPPVTQDSKRRRRVAAVKAVHPTFEEIDEFEVPPPPRAPRKQIARKVTPESRIPIRYEIFTKGKSPDYVEYEKAVRSQTYWSTWIGNYKSLGLDTRP